MDRSTQALSRYACSLRYEDLPAEVVHQVKRTLIDTMACALGGFDSEPARIARTLALAHRGEPSSRVIGTAQGGAPDIAGFANTTALRYLDYNDSYFSPGGGHPSDMIPAVLSFADPLRVDGRRVISAIVVAYEVFCRISDQVEVTPLGWDQGLVSVLGAVCGAGHVLGLNEEAMGHAISLAAVSNLPLGEIRVGELSMWKGCATANATRAAIFCAQLAQLGMSGPQNPLDGRRGLWQQAVGTPIDLGQLDKANGFRILSTIFKFYPAQIHTQAPTGLALELRAQLEPADITSVTVHTYKLVASTPGNEPEKWAPKTRETADHSIPYMVAHAFVHGAVTPQSFEEHSLRDPAISEFIAKMRIDEDAQFTACYPAQYNCRMEVQTRSGQRFEAATAYPKGHSRNPLSDAQVEDKFRALARDAITEANCEAALAELWTLEKVPNLHGLLDRLIIASDSADTPLGPWSK
jgi:2-methylcitrate dehydratase